MEVRKSALVRQSASTMFDLIEAAEHYPQFLPWCAGARIRERDARVVVADIDIEYRGWRFAITTRNPKERPHFMAITLERGPFRRFEGSWHLKELTEDACKVEFRMDYDFANPLIGRLAAPMFDHAANSLVDAFVARAGQMNTLPQPLHLRETGLAAFPAVNRPDIPAEKGNDELV
ncbi:MAG: type II toxin-antitoxin system RatA family toxin [Dokdonella sp.]